MSAKVGSEWEFPIEWSKVRDFARAVHDNHWHDESLVPPLTFLTVAAMDFVEHIIVEQLKLDRSRVVHGEQEYEYLRPLEVGDRLICRGRVAEDYMKEGQRGGRMRFVVTEIEFRDAATNAIIARDRSTAIVISPSGGDGG